jgi:septum site-determining protein MinD
MLSHEDIVDVLSIELIGLIPMDEQVVVSSNTGIPLVMQKGSLAGEAFKRIAMRLNGNTDLPIQIPQTHSGLWNKIGQKLGFGR